MREVRRNHSRAPDPTQTLDVMQPVNPAQPRADTAPIGTEQNPGLHSPPRDLVDAEADIRGARSNAVHGSTLKLGSYAANHRIGDALAPCVWRGASGTAVAGHRAGQTATVPKPVPV